MKAAYHLRRAVNIINLSTPLGLLLAAAAARGRPRRGPDGLIVVGGYRPPVPVARAFTLGNVILARRGAGSPLADAELLRHEARHATQYAFCLGPVMIPPYLLCAGISLLVCGDHASYNPFERLAGLADGGYVRRPPRRCLRRSPEGGSWGEDLRA